MSYDLGRFPLLKSLIFWYLAADLHLALNAYKDQPVGAWYELDP